MPKAPRKPPGYPDQDKPACAFWKVPAALTDADLYNSPMDAWQRDRCAMCGQVKKLVKDHDHATQLVRGLLCVNCNAIEGTSSHPAMVAYRAGLFPAAILGYCEFYASSWDPAPFRPDQDLRAYAARLMHAWAAKHRAERPGMYVA